jgi:glycosyltransferase involved in cell wall biosynthesis
MKISVVIPAYNEEDGISHTIKTIPTKKLQTAGYDVEILVVDNASTDNTAAIATKCGARVVYQPLRGYGNAYKAGFENATGDIIVTGDADATYPFDALPSLIQKFRTEDVHFMNTNRLNNLEAGVMRRTHVFGNWLLTRVMRLLFRVPFHDSQSGMWIFWRSVWPSLDVRHGGMPFSQEIKIEAHAKGFRCSETEVEYRQRVGNVKLSVVDAWRTMSELFKKRLVLRKAVYLSIEDQETVAP